MNMHSFRWIRLTAFSALAAAAITSCASAATDFNQVGKQMSLLLQNFHFSRKEFSDELSGKFLETYLRKVDPNKIFFTQQDVDALKKKYGRELDDYLMSGQMMDAAQAMHALYRQRAMQRIAYARDLLKKGGFTFDKDRSIERSRRKTAAWPKDEAEMQQVWKDMVRNSSCLKSCAVKPWRAWRRNKTSPTRWPMKSLRRKNCSCVMNASSATFRKRTWKTWRKPCSAQ